MRQFLYGVIMGIAFWLMWEKSDPITIFNRLNNATADAAKSTAGYRR